MCKTIYRFTVHSAIGAAVDRNAKISIADDLLLTHGRHSIPITTTTTVTAMKKRRKTTKPKGCFDVGASTSYGIHVARFAMLRLFLRLTAPC